MAEMIGYECDAGEDESFHAFGSDAILPLGFRADAAEEMLDMVQNEVLILGAGPAGMAAALELCEAASSFTVVDKNDCVGGLARTVQHGEFSMDIGGHGFFTKNSRLQDRLDGLMGDKWANLDRDSSIFMDDRYYAYPVEFMSAAVTLGPRRVMRMAASYAANALRNRMSNRRARSFEAHAVATFGRSLAEFAILNYAEKIWGVPCSEISADSSAIFFHSLSIGELVKNALFRIKGGPRNLNRQFRYPVDGAGALYTAMRDRVEGPRGVFLMESYPTEIVHDHAAIKRVVLGGKAGPAAIVPAHVLSSIPIPEFLSLLRPPPPAEVIRAAGRLKYRSYVYLLIALKGEGAFRGQWIHFPDKRIPFGRLTFMGNYSRKHVPPGANSVLVEFFCWEGEKVWDAGAEELFNMSIGWLERLGFADRHQVISCHCGRERYAYPIYSLDYADALGLVDGYLRGFENVQSIGRSSCFRYDSQDRAIEAGLAAAGRFRSR